MAMANGGLKRKTVQITIPENNITNANNFTSLLKQLIPDALVILSLTLNGDPTDNNQFVFYNYTDRFNISAGRYKNGAISNFSWDMMGYDLNVKEGTTYICEIITE